MPEYDTGRSVKVAASWLRDCSAARTTRSRSSVR
jgi:hypothetical protein